MRILKLNIDWNNIIHCSMHCYHLQDTAGNNAEGPYVAGKPVTTTSSAHHVIRPKKSCTLSTASPLSSTASPLPRLLRHRPCLLHISNHILGLHSGRTRVSKSSGAELLLSLTRPSRVGKLYARTSCLPLSYRRQEMVCLLARPYRVWHNACITTSNTLVHKLN